MELKDLIYLDFVLILVDFENFILDYFDSEVVFKQIVYGDIILFNKIDLVFEDRIDYLEFYIKIVNKGVRILRIEYSKILLYLILDVNILKF